MGKKDSSVSWTTIEEEGWEMVALCRCFEETKQQPRWWKNHKEDLQEGDFGGEN